MKLEDILDAISYQLSGSAKFQWACYGKSAIFIDFRNIAGEEIGSVIFDTEKSIIYEVTVEVPGEQLCYRWTNPKFAGKREAEEKSRNVSNTVAWDDVFYTDLEVEEDLLEKLHSIAHGLDYDKSVLVSVSLTEPEELALHRQAHECGMSTDEYVNMILRQEMELHKNQEEPKKKKKKKKKKS
jgi:hypothetical protein